MGAFEHFPYTNFQDLNLDWILKQLKALEDDVKEVVELSKTWTEQVDYLNKRMAKIEEENLKLANLYNSFVQKVESRFNELERQQIENFEVLKNQIENEFQRLQLEINEALSLFNERLNYLDNKLEETLNNLPSLIVMTSPFTGEDDSLQNIIYDIVNSQKTGSLTASEYDNLELTASAYDNYDLTAYDYDWHGKELLI